MNLAVTYFAPRIPVILAGGIPTHEVAQSGISVHGKSVTRMGQNTARPFKGEDCTVKILRVLGKRLRQLY